MSGRRAGSKWTVSNDHADAAKSPSESRDAEAIEGHGERATPDEGVAETGDRRCRTSATGQIEHVTSVS